MELTTKGKFNDSMTVFRSALQAIPLAVAKDQKEEQQLNDLITLCREYCLLSVIEAQRKSQNPATDMKRIVELAAYMSCCKIQPAHQILTLRLAMSGAFKAQNFVTASSFAKRIVTGSFGPACGAEVVASARKILAVAEQKGTDAHAVNFDTKAPVEDFRICCASLTPLTGTTEPTTQCPYCGATYWAKEKGKLCQVCELAEIGANTLGVQFRPL